MNPGGSMTGGAFKNSSSLLSRNREIEELKGKVERSRLDMENVQKKLIEIQNERSGCYSMLDAGASALQEVRVLENTARMNVEQLRGQRRAADEDFQQFQKECIELDRQTAEIREMKEESQKELKDSEAMEKAHTFAVETYQQRLDEERIKEADAQKALEAYHLDTASILQKAEFTASNLRRIEGEIQKLQSEKAELIRNREQAEDVPGGVVHVHRHLDVALMAGGHDGL